MYNIKSAAKMRRFGKRLAPIICKKAAINRPGALIIALLGELGAGKTQFAKGFADGLGIKSINSPTFVICKSYKIPKGRKKDNLGFDNFFHIDCYRLRTIKEARVIGLDKVLAGGRNIALIEWPKILSKILPPNALQIEFVISGPNRRIIKISKKTQQDCAFSSAKCATIK